MEHDLSHLNGPQREAVLHTEGALLVLAGAGSGKTTVLIERIAQIIRQGTAPWSILAITFTNKAAGELKARLEKMLGPSGMDVWAGTFHSVCVRILRREIEKVGYGRSFTIYDTDDSKRVLKDIIKKLNMDDKRFPPAMLLSVISKAKNAGQDVAEYRRANGQDYFAEKVSEVFAEYSRRLYEANALDFDDIIVLTVKLLKEYAEVREHYQQRFRYVVVDEYQDTNPLQYELVSMLADEKGNANPNICVVGDDDQSIYRFRGATIENILNFESRYPHAKVIRLEQNYRSTGEILGCANRVISNNMGRKGKTLWTGQPQGEPVTCYKGRSDSDEARYAADIILEGKRQGRNFKDYCVLYRMNAQSNRLEYAFKASGIPYRIVGGVRFYDRAEVKDMMAYLQVIHNHDDDLRLLRIINLPARGLGDKTLTVLQALAARDGLSVFSVLKQAEQYPELQKASRTLAAFAGMIETLTRDQEGITLPDFYDKVLERTGYAQMLLAKGDIESQGRLENVMELKSSLSDYQEENPEAGLGDFLDQVALITDIDKYDEDADAAVMMTMHASKGLEFPVVFIVGTEENLFPSSLSMASEQEIEEERRLCYVAVTRAREKLYVTCADERLIFGQTLHNRPSRFIKEMGLEYQSSERYGTGFSAESPITGKSVRSAPTVVGTRQVTGGVSSSASPRKSAPVVKIDLAKGEMVDHKAFGRGMVLAITPMGNDALLEIAFDGSGTKRLMLKAASQYLKKI